MQRSILILSGGMDSGVLLADSLQSCTELRALSFDYGAKHNSSELAMAKKLCDKYRVSHKVITLPFINELFNSALLKSGAVIPEGTYNSVNMASTVVPFRNGIMLSIAVGYAEDLKFETVLIGSHAGDHAVYPDCRPTFTDAISLAAEHGTYNSIKVLSPYVTLKKKEIAAIGRKIGFDFSLTWSCYKGGEKHCGVCATCHERKEALGFKEGADPTAYEG